MSCDSSSFGGSRVSVVNRSTKPIESNVYHSPDGSVTVKIGDKVRTYTDRVYDVGGFRTSGPDILADLRFTINGSLLTKCFMAMALEVIK